jgi:undecaprenyl-diphosphatase
VEFLASFLIWIMFFGLFVVWFSDGKIRREQVLHAVFAFAVSWFLADVIKTLFPTLRPFQVNGGAVHTLTSANDGAFPSGHAAASFALAVTIWLHDRKIGSFFLVGAVLIGIARVLANVHYPIDIIGGAALGTFIAYLFEKIHIKLPSKT